MKKLILAALAAVMLFSACEKEAPAPQLVSFSLDSNPTTGYSWTVTQEPELFNVGEEYLENSHEEGMTGVGGQQVFSLAPKEAGTSEVTFTYARPWEDPEADSTVVSYTVEVSKDMKIKVTASRFAGGDDINVLPQIPEPEIK